MPSIESPSFAYYRTEVEALLATGQGLIAVERMLDDSDLDEDDRSALWLLGRALGGQTGEREPVELRLVAGGDTPN
jgi:hypothetical protein